VFKAHRLLYHSTRGLRVIMKKTWTSRRRPPVLVSAPRIRDAIHLFDCLHQGVIIPSEYLSIYSTECPSIRLICTRG